MGNHRDTASTRVRTVSWWSTIFEPGWPALVTCATLMGFVALIVLGGILGDYRLWFHVPAVVGILTWHFVMMKRYRGIRNND